jgi:hypothetical protein
MSKREEIEANAGHKRYVRRDDEGQFKSDVDEGRSLWADRRHKAKHETKRGDRGDRQTH